MPQIYVYFFIFSYFFRRELRAILQVDFESWIWHWKMWSYVSVRLPQLNHLAVCVLDLLLSTVYVGRCWCMILTFLIRSSLSSLFRATSRPLQSIVWSVNSSIFRVLHINFLYLYHGYTGVFDFYIPNHQYIQKV